MKNKIQLILLFLFIGISAFSADISLRTRTLIENTLSDTLPKRAKSLSSEKINLYIITNSDFDKKSLDSLDITVESDFGEILTLLAPVESLVALTNVKGIDYLSAGVEAKPQLDVAVPLIRAGGVQRGEGLEQAYTGAGVITGFIDLGLDFTHPAFRSPDGSLRISRAWIQSESASPHPSGFNYGTEYVGKNALLGKRYSNANETHGTHVCAIAAGGRNLYGGIAPDAEIVFVETSGTDTQIADGVKYIFNYADAQKKPAVVNISMGTHYGSHDGKSATDRAFAEITGAGKIIVGSAGNNGTDHLHIRKTFARNTDTLRSIININPYENSQGTAAVIVWGDAETDFQAAFEVYKLDTKECVFRTNFLNTGRGSAAPLNETYRNIKLKMSAIHRFPTNSKSLVEIEITNPLYNNNYGVAIVLVGSEGWGVDLWNNGLNSFGAPFSALAGASTSGWTRGETTSTVTEIGGTGEAVITVGSFNSKSQWEDIDGNEQMNNGYTEGSLSFFSSQGPTADGRTKPEVAAPGAFIASAINSYANDMSRSFLVGEEGYGIMQGTSMAAPMVTGAVALMLQKNPELTPADIKDLLREFSLQDEYTGVIGENGSNLWGFGKLDIYNVISSRKILPKPKLGDVIVFYDAASRNIILQTEKEHNNETDHRLEISRVELFDISGRKLIDRRNITNQILRVSSLNAGVYLLKIHSGGGVVVRKALVY